MWIFSLFSKKIEMKSLSLYILKEINQIKNVWNHIRELPLHTGKEG